MQVAVQTDTLFAASPASRSPSAPKHQYASMAALQWQLQCMQEQLASMEGRGTRQRSSLHRDDARLMEYMQRLVDDKLEQDAERIAMLESRNVLLEYDILALSEEVGVGSGSIVGIVGKGPRVVGVYGCRGCVVVYGWSCCGFVTHTQGFVCCWYIHDVHTHDVHT